MQRTVVMVMAEALDNAWAPLPKRCEALTGAEYRWEPVPAAWTVRLVDGRWHVDWADPDPSPAPVTTIAWRCWHIAVDCLDSYSARLFGRRGTPFTGTEWTNDWESAADHLASAWDVFRTGATGWSDAELLQPLGPAWGSFQNHTNLDLVQHAIREVVHHGAEIALMRDLYRSLAPSRQTGPTVSELDGSSG